MRQLQNLLILIFFCLLMGGEGCKKTKSDIDPSYRFICGDTVLQGGDLSFYVSATNANRLFWIYGDGTTELVKNWNGTLNSHSFSNSGTFQVSLIVNDDSAHRFSKSIVV